MTENSKKVFNFLKEHHGVKMTGQEIAKELNIPMSAVTGSVNGLVRKDFAVREEVSTQNADGKPVITKYISLTDAGLAYDPDAEVGK